MTAPVIDSLLYKSWYLESLMLWMMHEELGKEKVIIRPK